MKNSSAAGSWNKVSEDSDVRGDDSSDEVLEDSWSMKVSLPASRLDANAYILGARIFHGCAISRQINGSKMVLENATIEKW